MTGNSQKMLAYPPGQKMNNGEQNTIPMAGCWWPAANLLLIGAISLILGGPENLLIRPIWPFGAVLQRLKVVSLRNLVTKEN